MHYIFIYLWLLLLVLLLTTHPTHAQENTLIFSGRLVDAISRKPITGAHILGQRHQNTSSEDGYFQVQIEPSTKLKITHVAYESVVLEVGFSETGLHTIALFPIIVDLDLVTVRPLPEESEFKQLILQAEVSLNQEEANLQQNISFIRSIQHLGYFNDMNSYDMFLGRIKDGGTVSFLSNNPSLGIIGLIKRLRQDKTVPSRRPHSDHIPNLWKAYKRKEGEYQWLFE